MVVTTRQDGQLDNARYMGILGAELPSGFFPQDLLWSAKQSASENPK